MEIIYYILLADSIGANLTVWFEEKWYIRNFRLISRWFPAARGWTAVYLAVVLILGYQLGAWPF